MPLVYSSTGVGPENSVETLTTGTAMKVAASIATTSVTIKAAFTQPGNPKQNRRHERMHLTLKKETTKPAANNLLQLQEV